MFCKNCGNPIGEQETNCSMCNAPKGAGARFCRGCGRQITSYSPTCPNCGIDLQVVFENIPPNSQYNANNMPQQEISPKNKVAAGILGIFLGSLGVHNFYLGHKGKAITQLCLSIVGFVGMMVTMFGFFAAMIGEYGTTTYYSDTVPDEMAIMLVMFILGMTLSSILISASSIWGFVEGIVILCSRKVKDGKGKLLSN